MTLRSRLALFSALLIALAVITQGAVGYVRYQRLALEGVDRDLFEYLRGTSLRLEHLLPRSPEREGQEWEGEDAGAPSDNPSARSRLIQDARVMANFGPAFPTEIKPGQPGVRSEGGWRVMTLALPQFGTNVRLEGAVSLRDRQLGLRDYVSSLTLTVPLLAVLGAVLAWFVAGRALAPLETLISTTQRVADSGDLTERVPDHSGRDHVRGGRGELTRLSSAFNRMLERLQGFRAREVSFVRYASHELRTPLTAMQAQLDAQREGWITRDETLETMRDQVGRMTRLSRALLVLAREGRTEAIVLDLARLSHDLAARHGAAYDGPKQLAFRGNPELLERALENLLENAARHASGTNVTVGLALQARQVCLSVSDGGPGLPPEALERASNAFYRAPGTRAPGSGLGLAVVERVAEAHGGTLELHNREPHGLRVNLNLPLEPDTLPADTVPDGVTASQEDHSGHKKTRA